ncbi:hypothetical protein SECTIM467_35 [Brevibacillus phage SecTim467]|uniref:Phage tail tape measure protein domain-containing protein n=2 Tax=Jenstvirus jenst TaxID=1982225 RepID=A0A0K2CPN3_9CAUD|nr:tail length tape measure protein [Brevibacillus phage Jenst]ALA07165.1 putative tail tape measure protein [Brevibacillus phage Jenst]ALA07534.1 hypothetical protein SECTIM467_35 [Brevibacillus phage SecTim467]
MNNIQTDIILEFQKSIENMARFGQEMETLDSRFGRLDQRIDALKTSMSAFGSQMNKGTGSNLRQQIEREMNNLISGNGVVLASMGNTPLKVKKETLRDVFQKVETELNLELQKFVRNLSIEIDPNYAKGQRLPISSDDFDAINKEVAKVIRLQIGHLVNAIQKHKANLIKPTALEGLEISIGKGTVLALVNKIKDEVIRKIENPSVAEASELKITKQDLNKVVTDVKTKLKKAFEIDVADVKSLDAKDVNSRVAKIPQEIDERLQEYVSKTVAGINGAMKGKMELPVKDLSKNVKNILARELKTTVSQLDNLGTVDLGSIRGYELKSQLERISKTLDKKLSKSVEEEVKDVVKKIEEVEIIPSPKLKRHLVNQINRVNNKIIEKIREQVDVQIQSLLQEISEVQARHRPLNRDQAIRQASDLGGNHSGGSHGGSGVVSSDDSRRRPTVSGVDPYSRRDEHFNSFGLHGAIVNTVRHILAGSIVGAPMMAMYQAVETFKNTNTEQIKMIQNLMLKPEYRNDPNDASSGTDFAKVDATVNQLRGFIRQQSIFYGIDYNELYRVGGIGSRLLEDPLEMKKFIQLTAQLKTVDPSAKPENIANGLESIKAQFNLEMAHMQEKVAQPMAAVSNVTNASVEQLVDALKRSGATFNNNNIDPATAIVLAGTSIQATALEGANIGNFYNSILNRLQSDKALSKLAELGVNPHVTDPLTGAQMLRPGEDIFQDFAKALSDKDDLTKRNAFDAMFGTYQSSKGAATMHEIMNNFIKVLEATKSFGEDQYKQMIMKSLDNPMVNANRAKESVSVAFDALVQELTPAINKVSYAIINMSDAVARNASLLVGLGDVLSNVLIGMLMMRGIKWGAGKVWGDVNGHTEMHKMRTSFLGRISGMSADGHMGELVGDDLKNMSRKDIGRYQKNPELERYFREMHGMNEKQQEHFKKYVADKKIDLRDLPTLFTAMEEAKNWTERKVLSDDEKFDRTKTYHNRLSTTPALANILSPELVATLNSTTSDRLAFNNSRANVMGYAEMADRMSRMSRKEFDGFENHLQEMHRNGAPAVDSLERLTAALDDYDNAQRQADTATRQSSPTFNTLSNAVRGMNNEMTRTQRLKQGFRDFLRSMPDLARGAASSIGHLSKNIAAMAGQIVAALGLAQAAKALTENMTLTQADKNLALAEKQDQDFTSLSNYMNREVDGSLMGFSQAVGMRLGQLYGTTMNAISYTFGGTPAHFGKGEKDAMIEEMKAHYGFKGSGGIKGWLFGDEEFMGYLRNMGIDPQEAVKDWAQKSGRRENTQKFMEQSMNQKYEEAQMKKAEEERLQKIAEENYKQKYQEGKLKFPTINADDVKSNIQAKIGEIKNQNTVESLRNLMGGMKTDSEDYLKMRQEQVRRIRQVLNEELATIDKYIANMDTIMKSHAPDSKEYKSAEQAKKNYEEARKKVVDEGEADILNEEFNLQQETFQKNIGKSNRAMQKIDLLAQAKELAAAYNMDTESQAYLDTMKQIAVNKVNSMRAELENMKRIQALGDQSEELAMAIMQTQNNIASEQQKVKEYNLASIGIGRQKIGERNSERENEFLELRLRMGNPDDSSPILRNKRIANAKAEVAEIQSVISDLKKRLVRAETEEAIKINAEIRDLTKQSLQAQLGILDEMKGTAGTFNLPDGVTAMTRYEYLTRQGTHQTTTVGMGDVTVNITLPNVTNGVTANQMQIIGNGLGQGLAQGRVGGWRSQMLGNPQSGYRRKH